MKFSSHSLSGKNTADGRVVSVRVRLGRLKRSIRLIDRKLSFVEIYKRYSNNWDVRRRIMDFHNPSGDKFYKLDAKRKALRAEAKALFNKELTKKKTNKGL